MGTQYRDKEAAGLVEIKQLKFAIAGAGLWGGYNKPHSGHGAGDKEGLNQGDDRWEETVDLRDAWG